MKRNRKAPAKCTVSPIGGSALIDALPPIWKSCSRTKRLSPHQFAVLLGLAKVKDGASA